MKNLKKIMANLVVVILITTFFAPSALAMTINNNHEFSTIVDETFSIDSVAESGGDIHLAQMYQLSGGYRIDYYKYSSGAWGPAAVIQVDDQHGQSWSDVRIATDSNGNVGITWLEGNSEAGQGAISNFIVKYAHSTDGGANWNFYDVVDFGPGPGAFTHSIAFNSIGDPYVFASIGYGGTIYKGDWDGVGFTFDFSTNTDLIPITGDTNGCDMVMEGDDIYIVTSPNYNNSQYSARFAQGSDGGVIGDPVVWSASDEVIVGGLGGNGTGGFAVDEISLDVYSLDGVPRIVVLDKADTGGGTLHYAVRTGGVWSTEEVFYGNNPAATEATTNYAYPKIIVDQATGEEYVATQYGDYSSAVSILQKNGGAWGSGEIFGGSANSMIVYDVTDLGSTINGGSESTVTALVSLTDSIVEGVKVIVASGVSGEDGSGESGEIVLGTTQWSGSDILLTIDDEYSYLDGSDIAGTYVEEGTYSQNPVYHYNTGSDDFYIYWDINQSEWDLARSLDGQEIIFLRVGEPAASEVDLQSIISTEWTHIYESGDSGDSYCGSAGNSSSYDTSAHSYVFNGDTYDEGPASDNPYSGWLSGASTVGASVLETSLNCAIDETPSAWHLVLAKLNGDGFSSYATFYYANDLYLFTDDEIGRAAMQVEIDSIVSSQDNPFTSGTVEAYTVNAFTYDGGTEEFTFFDTGNSTPGSTLSMMSGTDGTPVYPTVSSEIGYEAVAIIKSAGDSEGEATCESGTGYDYTVSTNSYNDGANPPFSDGSGSDTPYSFWVTDDEATQQSQTSLMQDSINCSIGVDPTDWHLTLATMDMGGLAYVSIYFAEDDFVITDAASAQTALDAWSAVEVGGATMDLIYYKLDAFAYDDIEDKYDFFDATESIVDLITVKNRSDLDFTTMMMANETGYEIPAIFVETDGEESGTVCTGSAADGDTYTSTFHGYYYDGQFYNDFHDQDNGGAGFIFDTSVQGDPVIAAMDVDTNISCGVLDYTQVGESGMNLHLVLVRGVMENDFYFPIYFSADEIQGEDDAEIASAIQTYLDGASSSWGFSSMTVVYAKKDAFEYSGEPNVEGTAYTLKDAEIVADGVTYLMGLSSGGTAYSDPAINITLGTSGEPVPEFKDYLLIVTIALALGLAYKVIPKTQLTKA